MTTFVKYFYADVLMYSSLLKCIQHDMYGRNDRHDIILIGMHALHRSDIVLSFINLKMKFQG